MYPLEVVAGGRRYLFDAGTTVVCGRSADAQVELIDRRVGRIHARLSFVDGAWVLRDENSSNGTWIAGQRVVGERRIDREVTLHLGNPVDGALVLLRPLPAGTAAATELVPPAVAPAQQSPPGQRSQVDQPARPAQAPDAAVPGRPTPRSGPFPPPAATFATAAPAAVPPVGPTPVNPVGPTAMNPVGPTAMNPVGPTAMMPAQSGAPWPGVPGAATPVLVLRLGARTLVFPIGTQVRVGRDPRLEAVSDHPMVAPGQHGVLTSDANGATYTDTSERGTYRGGRPLKGPLRITGPVVLRLGDPATGEELGVTPPLTVERMHAARRRQGTMRLLVAAAAAVCVLLAAGIVGVLTLRGAHQPASSSAEAPTVAPAPATAADAPTALSPQLLRLAETATVRLLEGGVDDHAGWGSGTVISSDGLILTNAHVAAPRARGLAVALAAPAESFDEEPPYLTVEFIDSDDSAAVARYRARPVAVDGYLDLAVVEIYADTNGNPVDRKGLDLPFLGLGDVGAVRLGQSVTILGFPGVSGSDTITVTTGVISTFIRDPLRHVDDPRFEMETTARVAHGNSGGAAITDTGQLVGVPSLAIPGQGSDLSWRLRSVAPARALIAAARSGTTYRSDLLVRLGSARVTLTGIGADARQACGGNATLPSGVPTAVFAFRYEGAAAGLDVAFLLRLPDGSVVRTGTLQKQAVPGLPQAVLTNPVGCIAYAVTAAGVGAPALPDGAYQAQLLGGENLDPMGPAATLRVGT